MNASPRPLAVPLARVPVGLSPSAWHRAAGGCGYKFTGDRDSCQVGRVSWLRINRSRRRHAREDALTAACIRSGMSEAGGP